MTSGETMELTVENIKKINSPRNVVGGPFEVLYINPTTRWALVTITWDGVPQLGFRYFTDSCGSPNSRGYPTWMVVPKELQLPILISLGIPSETVAKTVQFLFDLK